MMRWRGLLIAGETGVLLAMFGWECPGLERTVVSHGTSEESHNVYLGQRWRLVMNAVT